MPLRFRVLAPAFLATCLVVACAQNDSSGADISDGGSANTTGATGDDGNKKGDGATTANGDSGDGDSGDGDGGGMSDGDPGDSDNMMPDEGAPDSGLPDMGMPEIGPPPDSGLPDAGYDGPIGIPDSGGPPDAGPPDSAGSTCAMAPNAVDMWEYCCPAMPTDPLCKGACPAPGDASGANGVCCSFKISRGMPPDPACQDSGTTCTGPQCLCPGPACPGMMCPGSPGCPACPGPTCMCPGPACPGSDGGLVK
jgi:hypothetical protein